MARKRGGKTTAATPATVALRRAGVGFSVHAYEHDPAAESYGDEAAAALGVAAERVFKTLLADTGNGLVVAVVPVSSRVDLKALASAAGVKKATMADPVAAERATGYVVGGISPVGQRSSLPTVLDTSAGDFDTILVSGGRRGVDVELRPGDLARVTGATWARVSRPR
ncbi:MAG TPA: Cys-tRNA(Pro) deacylase [Ornithinimicrobium sp.]|uniref:Cys-tRNA(Pro) deacylase n=1 Tax=Ornithinimicrobium sp. TaxID=1977084 RepID=UPI002B45D18D|nr:Cys-tRNA(Pro) deacylase [Ornithinimicrobium sp.]HKJ12493.1 Cys-tRNA(Pro) deacylase [Ornithinimicrobium sp.]